MRVVTNLLKRAMRAVDERPDTQQAAPSAHPLFSDRRRELSELETEIMRCTNEMVRLEAALARVETRRDELLADLAIRCRNLGLRCEPPAGVFADPHADGERTDPTVELGGSSDGSDAVVPIRPSPNGAR